MEPAAQELGISGLLSLCLHLLISRMGIITVPVKVLLIIANIYETLKV